MRIQAAILTEANTPFQIETVTLDAPGEGEVLVKIGASGVCRSDWRVAIGSAPKPMPIITGHEGAGGIGLNIIHGAQLCGAHPIIAVDTSEAEAALASQFGATQALPSDESTVARIQSLTGGRGVDRAFEAVGIPAVQERAFAATRPGGTLTLVGSAPAGSRSNLPGAMITRTEKTVRGCSYGSVNPQHDIPLLLDLYRAGKLKLEQMITRRYRLDEINQAYADMLSGELARGIIVF